MNKIVTAVRNNGWLVLIILVSFILRVISLNYQSLWLDELHTMNRSNPAITWGAMFNYLKHSDQHPPLYFIIQRLNFACFGYTAFGARAISVIAGTVSIWAMFRLGKEVLNKNLGIICAIITAVNFYNISYSQEARPYILAFLFAALSFTWFIKLIKLPSQRTAIIYSVFTLLLLYSHYYSLFVVAAQVLLALLFIFQETGAEKKLLFKSLLWGYIIIGIGYLPCLYFLTSVAQIKSFWIQDIPADFIQNFFYGYFGNTDLLNPLLIILLVIFITRVALTADSATTKKIRDNPLLLSFTIILVWVAAVLLIPYLRSLITVPMLYPRYTIVLLPAIILALAYSIELFKMPVLKYLLTGLFVALSLINLFYVKKYYTEVSKTQFREMTQYVVTENKANFPIINEATAWHQQYYLNLFGSKANVYTGPKDAIIDSIAHKKSQKYILNGFWIVGAHNDKKPDTSKLKALDADYMMVKEESFYEAWAILYISKSYDKGGFTLIHYNDFMAGNGTAIPAEEKIAIWSGSIISKPVPLKKGKFKITINAMGTSAAGIYPHLNIYINGKKVTDYFVTGKLEEKTFDVTIDKDESAAFTIQMDNDLQVPPNQDRNAFVQYITIQHISGQ